MSTEIAIRKQLHDTIAGQDPSDFKPHVQSRSWGYVNDQQNGAYSNQVSFDLSSMVSQNAFLGPAEGYVLAPYAVKLNAATALTNAVPIGAVALKDSIYSNFVDSIQLFVNNKQLIDQTNLSNIPIQIMDKLTMSTTDLKLHGTQLGISPDTTTSITASINAASAGGDGVSNNYVLGDATISKELVRNKGLEERLSMFGNNGVGGTDASTPVNGSLMPYFSNDGTTKKQGIWNFVICVPLSRISDLLRKYPLVKGSQVRLVINFNAGSCASTFTNTGTTFSLNSTPTMTAGSTFPAMFVNGLKATMATATTSVFTLSAGIQTTSAAAVADTSAGYGYPALPQCRLYMPLYQVNPTYEERILANRYQTVRYMDWYQQGMNNIANGSAWSQTLTTALPNVKVLIGVPFLNSSVADSLFLSADGTPQYQSPFDTAPATTYPGLQSAFSNFNVQCNGVNVLSQNANFSFDIWTQQVQKLGLNGGLVKELASGLLDARTWSYSPFVIIDLSDRPESAEDTYQSVTVAGTNSSGKTVDIKWFIGFEKVVKFDVITGDAEKVFG